MSSVMIADGLVLAGTALGRYRETVSYHRLPLYAESAAEGEAAFAARCW